MPFDPHFALSTMLPLAEAAYDLTKIPSGWKLIDPIEPEGFGFTAFNDEWAVASIRGTEVHPEEHDPDREWLEDFDGLAVPNQYGKGMVHQGFQEQYEKIRASVLAGLAKADRKLKRLITGHSLGAPLAVQLQAELAQQGIKAVCYTWAGPRPGWHDYADWFKSLGLETNCIVNQWDEVPRLPPVINGYEHVGYQVMIDGGRPPLNLDFLKTAHNLELSYRPGMENLIAKEAA